MNMSTKKSAYSRWCSVDCTTISCECFLYHWFWVFLMLCFLTNRKKASRWHQLSAVWLSYHREMESWLKPWPPSQSGTGQDIRNILSSVKQLLHIIQRYSPAIWQSKTANDMECWNSVLWCSILAVLCDCLLIMARTFEACRYFVTLPVPFCLIALATFLSTSPRMAAVWT